MIEFLRDETSGLWTATAWPGEACEVSSQGPTIPAALRALAEAIELEVETT